MGLHIIEAKRNFFPVKDCKADGTQKIDPETGEPKMRSVPGGYAIKFNSGQSVSVTNRKVKTGEQVDGKDVYRRVQVVSVKKDGKPEWGSRPWCAFEEAYKHCGMPALVMLGMAVADEKLAEEREARELEAA